MVESRWKASRGSSGQCGCCMSRAVVQRAVDGQAAGWVALLASMDVSWLNARLDMICDQR
jgi:hypothetical protein